MGRIVEPQFDFPARYSVEQVERIERSGGAAVYGFPNAVALDPQQEMADRPIIRVNPASGDPWVGVFSGGSYAVPPAARGRLIGWPDELSVCVVYTGGGVVVRTDAPQETFEIESFPITGVLVVSEHGLVVFSDFTSFAAYDRSGMKWRTEVASDGARLLRTDGDELVGVGFLDGVEEHPVRLSLTTGWPAH